MKRSKSDFCQSWFFRGGTCSKRSVDEVFEGM